MRCYLCWFGWWKMVMKGWHAILGFELQGWSIFHIISGYLYCTRCVDKFAGTNYNYSLLINSSFRYGISYCLQVDRILPKLPAADGRLRVWPHRKRAAAAGSDSCPRREGLRTVLRKTASFPWDWRRAGAADISPPSVWWRWCSLT